MRMGTRLRDLIAVVVVVAVLLELPAVLEASEPLSLTILVTSGTGGRLETDGGRTAAELASTVQALAKQARAAGDNVMVVDAGRTLAPYAESRFDGGRLMLDVLASAGVQVFVPSAMDLGAAGDQLASRSRELGIAPVLPYQDPDGATGAVEIALDDGLRVAIAGLSTAAELADAVLPGEPQPAVAAEAFVGVGDALQVAVVHSGGHGRDITSRQLTWRLIENPNGIDLVLDPDLGYAVELRRHGAEGDVYLVGRDRDQRDPWDVARLRLELVHEPAGWTIARMTVDEVAASRHATWDGALEARIRQHMAAFRADVDRLLPPGAPTDRAQLERFVLEAMRERAGAEITVLNRGGLRPVDPAMFGDAPLRYEAVMRLLSLDQELALVTVDGAGLRQLVVESLARVGADGEARSDALRFAGLEWRLADDGAVADLEVNGRPLRDGDRYWVATTGYLLAGGDEYPPLEQATRRELPGGGRPEIRSDVVMARLARASEPFRDLRHAPVWRFGVTRLGLGLNGVETERPAAYDDVSDSRVNAPSSVSGRFELDVYTTREVPRWRWENLLRGRYAVIDTVDGPRDELDDDLRLDTSLVFTAVTLLSGGSPYASAILDTEVNRNRADDGTLLPRQLEESLSAGLTWSTGRWPRLRVGGVVRHYSNEERVDQSGLLAEAQYRLEPAAAGRRPGLEGRLYLESLWGGGRRIARLDLDLRLLVPVFGDLMVVPAVNWYSYDDSSRGGRARSLRYALGLSWSFATRSRPGD